MKQTTKRQKQKPRQARQMSLAELTALGLPKECRGGQILDDSELAAGARWVEFELDGVTYGVGYDLGPEPFGRAARTEPVDVSILGTWN